MPDTCDLGAFDKVKFPLPENFYDKYEGRIAASEQEMNIFKDMDLVYDLKMADKENEIHTKTGLEGYGRAMYKRMNPQQKLPGMLIMTLLSKILKPGNWKARNWRSGSINVICMII